MKKAALLEGKYKAIATTLWNNQKEAEVAGARLSGFPICVIGSSATERGIAVTKVLERMKVKCDWIDALPKMGDVIEIKISSSEAGRRFKIYGLPDVTEVQLESGVHTNTPSLQLAIAITISHLRAVKYMVQRYPGEPFLVTEDDVFWPAVLLWPCTLAKVWEDRPEMCEVLSLNSTFVPSQAGAYFPWKSPAWGTPGVVYMWGSQAVIYSAEAGQNFVDSLLYNTVMKVQARYSDTTRTIMVIDNLTPAVASKSAFVANHKVLHCSLPEDFRFTPFTSLAKLKIQVESACNTMQELSFHHQESQHVSPAPSEVSVTLSRHIVHTSVHTHTHTHTHSHTHTYTHEQQHRTHTHKHT